MASLAPMRTKMASTGVISRLSAGTQAPTCAISAAKHTCRSSVLFPANHRVVSTLYAHHGFFGQHSRRSQSAFSKPVLKEPAYQATKVHVSKARKRS